MKTKILFYNWIPFDETDGRGGGVTIYTRNLIRYLTEHTDWDIYFLSSGRAYDRKRKETFIERTTNIFRGRCKSFQVVNSPVLSSAKLSFAYPGDMLEDRVLKTVVGDFLAKQGGFDIVHFQNFEGLSLSVMELKEDYPETRFIYSLHNYYLFCPQVMLWKDDSENCAEKDCGGHCISCMPERVHKRKVIYNQQINYERTENREISEMRKRVQAFMEKGYRIYDRCLKGRMLPGEKERLAKYFQLYRKRNVQYINQYMDLVLAVSERVSEIAIEQGVNAEKVKVDYIGTEAADGQKQCGGYPYDGKVFYICYLGYMRKMKGFYFLLDALERMPEKLAKNIGIKLAVKITDDAVQKRIEKLEGKFAEVIQYQGYSHDQLPEILRNVQLGIVPPLWEDNLPQVAIEMRSQGIPVLSSNLGGAKELTCSQDFVFRAGDTDEFIEKINFFVRNPEQLEEYWRDATKLTDMKAHVEALKTLYMP